MPRKSGGFLISGGQNHQQYRLVLILISEELKKRLQCRAIFVDFLFMFG